MRLRNIPTAREELTACPTVLTVEEGISLRGAWSARFSDAHRAPGRDSSDEASGRPLYVEIGMGKGQFLLEMAARHPEADFIGIEQYSSVLVHAARKMNALAQAGTPLTNLLLLRMNAEQLCELFAPGEVDRIYLNFSDPWPKDRHAKRRLPGRVFLERFAQVLNPNGVLEFKTDNRPLFDFALEEAGPAGWIVEQFTYDLHHTPAMNAGNVMTEYEERFSAMGNPICKLIEHPQKRSTNPTAIS